MQRITTNHAGAARIARTQPFPALLVVATVLAAGAAAAAHWSPGPPSGDAPVFDETYLLFEDLAEDHLHANSTMVGELQLDTLKFFIEFNETDADVGVQCLLGGEPYKVLRGYGPDERRILDLRPRRGLRDQGMSDFFFESAEPTLEEFPLEDFLERFPAGEYEFETITIENDEQEGETMLTHMIPAGPVIVFPQKGDVVDKDDLVVTWEPVTLTTAYNPPQVPVNIVGYQIIVTREDPLRIYLVEVSADTTSVSVPPEFLDEETEYELEILAIEESDNQTISLLFFETK